MLGGEDMAEGESKKTYPMLSVSHWWALRKKFRQSIPGVVSDSYLATVLGMGVNSARANVTPFLKTLGIVDKDGKPTERAKLWRDDQHYSEVCQAIIEEVYPSELVHAVSDPSAEKSKARSWFAQQTGVGENAAGRMVALYAMLVEADASKQPDQDKKQVTKKVSTRTAATTTNPEKHSVSRAAPAKVLPDTQTESHDNTNPKARNVPLSPEVNINLQIHISADASPDQIEQIFASMSKHLYGHG
jgi:hypothetical protein